MPGSGTPPSRQSVPELWTGMFFFPAFGGVFLSAMLGGTAKGGEWSRFWALVAVGAFIGAASTVIGVSHLSELERRRERTPRGTARHPILVAGTLALLLM